MRLFIAVELGKSVQDVAASLIDVLRHRAAREAPHSKVTWVEPGRMHLTLRFIGEVDAARAERILNVLREPIALAPFSVRWQGLGAFPKKGPPRVLWVGVVAGAEALTDLEAAVSARLVTLEIPREERPYSPHLTLGRVRDARGLRTAALFQDLAPHLGETRVEAITLFESRLSPKGPTYTKLQQTPLRVGPHD